MSSAEGDKVVKAAEKLAKDPSVIPEELSEEQQKKIRTVLAMRFRDKEAIEERWPFPDELEEHEGVYTWMDRVIVTQDIADEILAAEYKEIGVHSIGRIRFYTYLRERYWGIGQHQVQNFLNGDEEHQVNRQRRRSQVSRSILASRPSQMLSCDLTVHKGLGREGYLVIIDHFSKFLAATPYTKKTGASIAQKFEKLLPQFKGKVTLLRTDNGGEFVSPEFKAMLESRGIKHVKAQAATPTSMGQIEQANRTLKSMLTASAISASRKPSEALTKVLRVYNQTVIPSLGFSPAQLNTDDLPDRIRKLVRAKLIENASGTRPNERFQPPLSVGDKVRIDVKWEDAKIRAAIKSGTYKASHNETFSRGIYTVKTVFPASNSVSLVEIPGKRVPRGDVLLVPPVPKAEGEEEGAGGA